MRAAARKWAFAAGAAAAAAAVTAAALASETLTYTYDAKGRLVTVVRTDAGGNNVTTNYSFDKADNRTAKATSP